MQTTPQPSNSAVQSEDTGLAALVARATGPAAVEVTADADEGVGELLAPVRELVHEDRLGTYRESYLQEYQPSGPTEHALVRQLASHAATLDLWDEAAGAIQRQGVRELLKPSLGAGNLGAALHDAVLAGAMTQENVERCEKYLKQHSRAFHRALGKLEETQARRKKTETDKLIIPSCPFETEAACEAYLIDRFKIGKCPCPRCGTRNGHHIGSRRCWQCAGCGCQTGLRHGTVMADSPLPLLAWFTMIWLLLWRPMITATELVSVLGINRIMTVRSMATKVRVAMAAENASALLAGLDVYHATCRAASPESSAREERNTSAPVASQT